MEFMSEMPVLELKQIHHAYDDVVAVDDFSLSVAAGEVVCLLGPSGCGKTTVLRVAAGLATLQRGAVSIGGRIVAAPSLNLPPERRGIGFEIGKALCGEGGCESVWVQVCGGE